MTDARRFTGPGGLAQGLALGAVGGVLSGLFGIGGGAVLVPLLVLVAHLPQHTAHATSLAAIVLTALSATLAFWSQDAVAFGPGLVVAAGAITGAWLGAGLMHRLSAVNLRRAFAVLLVLTAVQLLSGLGTPQPGDAALLGSGAVAVVGFALLGLAAGVLSALMGVGGGVIMVPALVLLAGLSQHTAEGTSLLVIVPTSVMGAVRHARRGYTDWRLGLLLGVGGILGAQAGAQVALRLDAARLAQLFGVFLLLTAAQLLTSGRSRRTEPAEPV